ncbi:nucleotidyltransferase domain-containing protein [Yersinia kristensenii]|uniref:nucleotidyltransferase domain-containing protein n=1 Tax=Yersinia kristensenii TaxID=28152 RepID=UPI0005E13419|nr:nucleotidyltransferase domain-containing protein [Yersinia kristensenii]CFR25160.1 Predicted nucleotidyltransferases [Yersinia kristensenii]
MVVNADGFIETIAFSGIQHEFEIVIEDVCYLLHQQLSNLIHSIYIYGSVAEGCAVPYQSDLDLSIILTRPPLAQETNILEDIRKNMECAFPVVSKIDFDMGILSEIEAPEGKYSWGYWLKHHCKCLWGHDLSKNFEHFKPSRSIALAVNGDFNITLQNYITRIEKNQTGEDIIRLQKEAARKLIRSTNILRRENDSDWPKTLEEHAAKVIERHPESAIDVNYFLAGCHKTQSSSEQFVKRLKHIIKWIEKKSQKL